MPQPLTPARPAAVVQRDIDAWLRLPEVLRLAADPRREVLPRLWAEWLAADRGDVAEAA